MRVKSVDVSVVIPVRNSAELLEGALNSVMSQTWCPREVIVVDDHSTEDIEKVTGRFPGVIYLANQLTGVAEARNAGAGRATMPYLAFLDADDIWPETRIERQLTYLKNNPSVDLVSGCMSQFRLDPAGETIPLSSPVPTRLPSVALLRRDAFLKIGPFNSHWDVGETLEWWSRALDSGLSCGTVPDTVLMRRVHARNLGKMVEKPATAYLQMLHSVVDRRRKSGLL